MATETSTIRVPRAIRDLLAEQAHLRGISLAALLGEMAHERRRDAIWRSERNASLLDAQRAASHIEIDEWESTLGDGLG